MSIEFKIGMIAPRGAGKSSLLLAIYDEVSQRVAHGNLKFRTSNEDTNKAMNRVQSQFRASIDSATKDDMFVVPQLASSEGKDIYDFTLIIPSQNNDSGESNVQKVRFSIMDYPGNLLGQDVFETEIAPFLNESITLLVPISADLAMTWLETLGKTGDSLSKNSLAREKLQVGNVVRNIADWIKYKVENNFRAQLIFVPIKCEKYFDDNGGTLNQSADLVKAVCELYIRDLEEYLKKVFTTSEEIEKVNSLINCKIFAVDTYGIAELRNVALKYNKDHEPDKLESSFRRRPQMGNDIRMKNAYELLIDIVGFQVNEILNVRRQNADDKTDSISEYMKKRGWGGWFQDNVMGRIKGNWSPLKQKEYELAKLKESIAPVTQALDSLGNEFVLMPQRQLIGDIISDRD